MSRRLLILLENEPYPHDRRVRQEAESLAHAGYEVTVAGPTGLGFDALEETIDGVRALRYRAPPEGRGVAGYVREYGLALLRLRRLCSRVLREGGVEVVIVCNPPDFLILLARRLKRRGAAVVFDHHDLSPELYERRFARRGLLYRLLLGIERWTLMQADSVIAVNKAYADLQHSRGGVAKERIFVVHQCPDPDRFFPVQPRPELRRGRPFLVTWMGMMTQPERVQGLIDAADELVNARGRTDIGFTLIGPGDARDDVAAEVRRRGLSEAFELPGRLDDQALREHLATADLCVSVDYPNDMNRLSTVTKVLEYMAVGRPVLQWRLDEMERQCGNATAYARAGDPHDLADQILALLEDPHHREAVGEAGRARVLDGLTWPYQVPKLLQAVNAAIRHRQAA